MKITTTTPSLLIAVAFGCFALSPRVQAVVPAPDGGYPGGNTAEGQAALHSLTTGTYNTAAGFLSLNGNTEGNFNTTIGAGTLLANTADENTATGAGAIFSNTTGSFNTAHGAFALLSNTEGTANTADGDQALFSNLTGRDNTANGISALFNNITGRDNTAIGALALFNNTTGNENTATGVEALFNNTTGNFNTAIGLEALFRNTEGTADTADGYHALFSNTEGASNTACGTQALLSNTTGVANTVTGASALSSNSAGGYNTANGYRALFTNGTGIGNAAIGDQALFNNTIDNFNTALGAQAGTGVTTADNVICIGHNGQNVPNSCFIGNIRGATTANGDAIPVGIDSLGQLGTMSSRADSRRRFNPIDKISESILALKPVTFHYKSDKTTTPQFGLIAEEVAEVNPDLVVCDKNGDIYTVRYEAVNAMSLNEFLKEHKKVEAQQATISEFKSTVARQQNEIESITACVEEQAAQIQKVIVQIQINKSAPQMALNQ
jgi:trimeric autotransporter adhesin